VPTGGGLFGGQEAAREHIFHLVAPGARAGLQLRQPPVLHVDMRRLVDGLVDSACRAGVELQRGTLTGVELERDRVRAVKVETEQGEVTLRAALFIDASGIGGAVRSRVPLLARACPPPPPGSRCVAAEFQFEVKDRAGLEAFLAAHGAVPGHDVSFAGIAGGYSSLTVFTHRNSDEVGVLAGSIPSLGVPDGGALLDRFVASAPWLGARVWGGRGAIPVQRVYDHLGGAGVALVGDAACQVHAAHGSGVGIGLIAARLLANAVARSDDPGGDAALSLYERSFHWAHGGVLAGADAFRRYMQKTSRADLSALLGGLLEERLASAAFAQRAPKPDLAFLLATLPRAARAPGAALRFLPFAARTALVERTGALGGLPRIGRRLNALVGATLGTAPTAPGAGPWSVPSGSSFG
jgi:flavin-dependent dehydrogenase